MAKQKHTSENQLFIVLAKIEELLTDKYKIGYKKFECDYIQNQSSGFIYILGHSGDVRAKLQRIRFSLKKDLISILSESQYSVQTHSNGICVEIVLEKS